MSLKDEVVTLQKTIHELQILVDKGLLDMKALNAFASVITKFENYQFVRREIFCEAIIKPLKLPDGDKIIAIILKSIDDHMEKAPSVDGRGREDIVKIVTGINEMAQPRKGFAGAWDKLTEEIKLIKDG